MLTTTKFANECIDNLTYGSTQANWLANIDIGDTIFISQFNYKSQNLFGPFRVTEILYYDKTIIYPQQKYFYRIQYAPLDIIKNIEETDLYLSGVRSNELAIATKLINLIQQNKHLHCICLTREEGNFILNAFKNSYNNYSTPKTTFKNIASTIPPTPVDCNYIWNRNNIDRKGSFSSESDLEAFLLFSLKKAKSDEYKYINNLLNKHADNDLQVSEIYNQFVFGNAYPSDILIINKHNMNVFELKKDELANTLIPQIEKEMKKLLYFSLFCNRFKPSHNSSKRFNLYLVYLKTKSAQTLKNHIIKRYHHFCNEINALRKNTIIFGEYEPGDKRLVIEEQ